jgi:hypothetical protein
MVSHAQLRRPPPPPLSPLPSWLLSGGCLICKLWRHKSEVQVVRRWCWLWWAALLHLLTALPIVCMSSLFAHPHCCRFSFSPSGPHSRGTMVLGLWSPSSLRNFPLQGGHRCYIKEGQLRDVVVKPSRCCCDRWFLVYYVGVGTTIRLPLLRSTSPRQESAAKVLPIRVGCSRCYHRSMDLHCRRKGLCHTRSYWKNKFYATTVIWICTI